MKYLLLFILSINISFCAQIDTKLFDTAKNVSYFKEIEQQILKEEKTKAKSNEIINIQKAHLKRLEESTLIKVPFEKFDLNSLKEEENLLDSILKAIFYISELEIKEKKQNELLIDIQNKLALLKKRIENILEEEKKYLLSYQLQYAYYKIQRTNIESRLQLATLNKNNLIKEIDIALKKEIKSSSDYIKEEINKLDIKIRKIKQEKVALELELEKELINENYIKKEDLEVELQKLDKPLQNLLREKINFLNKKLINTIIQKNDSKYLKIYDEIDFLLLELNGEVKELYQNQNLFIKELAKKMLGNTKLIISNSLSQSKNFFDQFKGYFTSTLFVFNEQSISFLSLVKAILLIIFGFLIGSLYKKWIYKISNRWPNMSQMLLKLTSNVGFYLIVFITTMISMGSLGIDMSSISLIAGALSIGIGFGLQTVVSNLIAGIILMFERTIRIGDIIEIDALLKGTVTDIRIRSTTIKTFDNIDIIIPNSSFIQNNVINWTLDDVTRRLHIPFGVAYGTKIETVKEVILTELDNCDLVYIKDVKDKEPEIRFDNMNMNRVELELLVWVKANDKFRPNSLKSDFLILIYNSLYKHNIEIPFPQLDLHLKKK